MFFSILYVIALILELIFLIGFSAIMASFIYSSLKGSPYVPTKVKEINFILKEAQLKPNQLFFELGCGDARVSREAVRAFSVHAVAIDINPILIWLAKFLAKLQKIKTIEFKIENIFLSDVSKADVVYLFLMPDLLRKLKSKLQSELKKNSLIISHGFKIEGWHKYLVKVIRHKPFPTYFYRV